MAGKKLLVADDSATIQKVIRLALAASSVPGRDRHYEIQSVSDGNDLFRHLEHSIPDAILIDVSLPQKSAFEIKSAVDKMGDRYSRIRFVLLIGSDERIEDARLKELGFSGVLSKPFEPSHLRQVLADALDGAPTTASSTETESAFPPTPPPPENAFEAESDVEIEALPPPPLDFGEEEAPPALPDLEDELPSLPPLPDAPGEKAESDLWNAEEEERLQNATQNIEIRLQAPELPEAPAASSPFSSRPNPIEEDIRKLAETTLRLSGFEESASKDSPLEPSSIFPERNAEAPGLPVDDTGWAVREPSRVSVSSSLPPRMMPPSLAQDLGGATFPRETLGLAGVSTSRGSSPLPPDSRVPGLPSSSHPLDEPSVVPLSMEQMEQILDRQLRATLQTMAEKMLPEIATRILKDEIHRMLTSDNP